MTRRTITAPPGAIAGQDWYERVLDKRMRQLPADSTIIAIGSYGYDWVKGGPGHRSGSFRRRHDHGARHRRHRSSSTPPPTIRISPTRKMTAPAPGLVPGWRRPPSTRSMPPIPTSRPAMRCGGWARKIPPSCPCWAGAYNRAGAGQPASTSPTMMRMWIIDGEGEILRVEADPAPGARISDHRQAAPATSSMKAMTACPPAM